MDQNQYKDINASDIIPYYVNNMLVSFILPRDNYSHQTSRTVKCFLLEASVIVLEWSEQSPENGLPLEDTREHAIYKISNQVLNKFNKSRRTLPSFYILSY